MKSNYEEKRAARLEAFKNLASKNFTLSQQLFDQSTKMASVIPFGQPILVGHHSERSDRNYRAKIWGAMDNAVKAGDKAAYYKDKAQAAESNKAISSDNPEALELLQEKLIKLLKKQELYKSVNKIVKSKKTSQEDKVLQLQSLGVKKETAESFLEPDRGGRVGIPAYELTNNNGVINNVRKRILDMERLAQVQTTEEELYGVTLKVSAEDNRVQIFFPGKPLEEVRTELKRAGFHWSPFVGAWMRLISRYAYDQAKSIILKYYQKS